jgi:FtsH-binding integral membrane protein
MGMSYTREWEQAQAVERGLLTSVYGWMTGGLALTGLVALLVYTTPALARAVLGSGLFWVLIVGELALVFALSAFVGRMSPATAALLFIAYSALNGLTLSVIFFVYTAGSLASTFFVTAGTFGVMSAYGYVTKRDLSRFGSLLGMALIGLIIASVVNLFWANPALYWAVTYAGVLIFVGLTAYDTQRIKAMAHAVDPTDPAVGKLAIIGALALYLDFINLFLMLLRLLGRRK